MKTADAFVRNVDFLRHLVAVMRAHPSAEHAADQPIPSRRGFAETAENTQQRAVDGGRDTQFKSRSGGHAACRLAKHSTKLFAKNGSMRR